MEDPGLSNNRAFRFPRRTLPDRQTNRLTNRLGFKHSPVRESGLDTSGAVRPRPRTTGPKGREERARFGPLPKNPIRSTVPAPSRPTIGPLTTEFPPTWRHGPAREFDRSRSDGPLPPPRPRVHAHPIDERAASRAKGNPGGRTETPNFPRRLSPPRSAQATPIVSAIFPTGHRSPGFGGTPLKRLLRRSRIPPARDKINAAARRLARSAMSKSVPRSNR
jgi:hypothetical protein